MSETSDSATNLPATELTSDEVADWLRLHPDFLETRPEVIAYLLPAQFRNDPKVVDMQAFLLERLQQETITLRHREQQLLAAVDDNTAGQARIHRAILAVINASTVRTMSRMVRTKLPGILDISAAALCSERGPVSDGTIALETRSVAKYIHSRRRVALLENTAGDPRIFGAAAERIRSIAYIRLRAGGNAPVMMLALGSDQAEGFHQGQATDLLMFLADVVEVQLRLCLKKSP